MRGWIREIQPRWVFYLRHWRTDWHPKVQSFPRSDLLKFTQSQTANVQLCPRSGRCIGTRFQIFAQRESQAKSKNPYNFDAFPVYVTVDGNNFASKTSSVTEPCASSAFSTDQISAAQFHFSGRAKVPGRDLKTTISHKWVVG